jgi:hypothetical protein
LLERWLLAASEEIDRLEAEGVLDAEERP